MICVIDYQSGNLRSVQKGFEKVGHQATIVDRPEQLADAEKLVLPGVGAFEDSMVALRRRELVDPIRDYIATGRPFLGICLGLQLLFDTGYEDGQHAGLGILRGEVVRFDLPAGYKVPHMGWNQLEFRRPAPVFAGLEAGTHVYFVHSYYAVPSDEDVIATVTDYHTPFCSAVWRDNLFATQFHPEKSQTQGLRILQNFAEL